MVCVAEILSNLKKFLDLVFLVSLTNFSPDLHWTLWGESWTMSRFRGALNTCASLLDSKLSTTSTKLAIY